jgi:hypothetical protein
MRRGIRAPGAVSSADDAATNARSRATRRGPPRPGLALAVAAATVAALWGTGCSKPRPTQAPISNAGGGAAAPAASELDTLVAAVLARLGEEDAIPDAGLLPKEGPAYVLTEVEIPGDKGNKGDTIAHIRTLPQQPRPFVGKTRAELEAEADRNGDRVAFVRFYSIRLSGNTALVSVGIDVELAGRAPKLCCCLAEDRYDRRDGRWTFTSRGSSICS